MMMMMWMVMLMFNDNVMMYKRQEPVTILFIPMPPSHLPHRRLRCWAMRNSFKCFVPPMDAYILCSFLMCSTYGVIIRVYTKGTNKYVCVCVCWYKTVTAPAVNVL